MIAIYRTQTIMSQNEKKERKKQYDKRLAKRLPYYAQDFKNIDFRKNPELYRIGVGEQGVLSVEPYKSEIGQYWRFKDVPIATKSSKTILAMFRKYLRENDFVGADMARKFLQMGWTRARRYANHKGGRKYKTNPQESASWTEEKTKRKTELLPQAEDALTNEKAQAAAIFYDAYTKARTNTKYLKLKAAHKEEHERKI